LKDLRAEGEQRYKAAYERAVKRRQEGATSKRDVAAGGGGDSATGSAPMSHD